MSKIFLLLISLLILLNQLGQLGSTRRQLIGFQVYEEDNVYKSTLSVDSLVDVESELRKLINKVDNESTYEGVIDMKLPVPMKLDVRFRQASSELDTSTKRSKTIYRLNLNIGNLYSVDLDVNQTTNDGHHQFTSELDFNSILSKITGKYLGTLRFNHKDQCPKLTLYHNFTTNIEHLVHFASNLTEECGQPNANVNETEDRMKITIDFSNLINDLFDFKLDQLFVKRSKSGSELMNLFNKIYGIEVYGNYDYLDEKLDPDLGLDELSNLKYQFYKKAVFKSNLPAQFPTFQLKYVHDDRNENKIKLSFELKNELYKRKESNKDEL